MKSNIISDTEKTKNTAVCRLPYYTDIPDVGLLLDQTARLINGYLEPLDDISITNSMISNYVKHQIIARPVKKLYYREQIASLIFIAIAKTVLSLEDISSLLESVRAMRENSENGEQTAAPAASEAPADNGGESGTADASEAPDSAEETNDDNG